MLDQPGPVSPAPGPHTSTVATPKERQMRAGFTQCPAKAKGCSTLSIAGAFGCQVSRCYCPVARPCPSLLAQA